MTRFSNRPLEWMDVLHRFDEQSSSLHVRYAISYIDRLASDGARLLRDQPSQADRWRQGCQKLKDYIHNLRIMENHDLATALREFIQEFEHTTFRIYQIRYGIADITDNNLSIPQLVAWFDLIYRTSTYAIIASYIPDKEETNTLVTHINLTTGTQTTTGEIIEPQVPKKYRKAAKPLR